MISTAKYPFLFSDFFRSMYPKRGEDPTRDDAYYRRILRYPHTQSRLRVFLCGQQLADRHFDLRRRLQVLIDGRMGCDSFLGEDIEKFRKPPKVDADLLSIEVDEAVRSDLIILFLESMGTTAELTAFALSSKIVDKLVVFNDVKNKDSKSFLNLGPLALLKKRDPEKVVLYNRLESRERLSWEVVSKVDKVVCRAWFDKSNPTGNMTESLTFDAFVVLALIYASYPVRMKELASRLEHWYSQEELKAVVDNLWSRKFLQQKRKEIYLPKIDLQTLGLHQGFVSAIARVRSILMGRRLLDVDVEADFRLIS